MTHDSTARAETRDDSDDDQIALLSREQALELIPALLVEGEMRSATELSQLISSRTEDGLWDALPLQAALQAGGYADGIALFEARDLKMPVSAEVHRMVGLCYGLEGASHVARHHLLIAKRLGVTLAVLDLSDLELRELRPVAALRWLEEARRTRVFAESHSGVLHHHSGRIHDALGDFSQARLDYRQAIDEIESVASERALLVSILADFAKLEFGLARFSQANELYARAQRLTTSSDLQRLLEVKQQLCLACLGFDIEGEMLDIEQLVSNSKIRIEMLLDLAWIARLDNRLEDANGFLNEVMGAQGRSPALRFAIITYAIVLLPKARGHDALATLTSLLEPGMTGQHLEALAAVAQLAVQLSQGVDVDTVASLDRVIESLSRQIPPLEIGFAWTLRAEALLALGRLEQSRRDALRLVAWWQAHGYTPVLRLWLDHAPRLSLWMRRSGDPKLRLVHAHVQTAQPNTVPSLRLVTLTARPELLLEDQPVPLGNRHVVPLLAYLRSRGEDGASIAEVGRDLYPELRGERLRNRVKNARIDLQNAVSPDLLTIASEGGTRSMRLRIEIGTQTNLEWDLEELQRALGVRGSDWVWLLTGVQSTFLESHDEGNSEGWIAAMRDQFSAHLLERAAHLIGVWFAAGRLEDVQSLAAMLLQRGLLDLEHPLAEVIAGFDVRAAGTLLGSEAALATWTAQKARFRSAYVARSMRWH
jgi:tetratricopeptide (TPR) repeat protein